MLARALRLFLAAALLFAWQGALLHPLEHVDHAGGLIHVPGHDEQGSGATAGCDALAATAVFVAGGGLAFAPDSDTSSRIAAGKPTAAPAPSILAYRSQAPPQHS